jgi:hypothetical protein
VRRRESEFDAFLLLPSKVFSIGQRVHFLWGLFVLF